MPTGFSVPPPAPPEFLLLVNGVDDDGDGFVDLGFDGVDNNNNNLIDNYDPTEIAFEPEKWIGAQVQQAAGSTILRYVAKRRPIVARGARETLLPSNVVVDLTSWNYTSERSRLPVNGLARYIDILVAPNGQIIQSTSYSSPASYISPFLHIWLTDRDGVVAPTVDRRNRPNLTTTGMALPMPEATPGYAAILNNPARPLFLEGERMLITISTRTGNMAINSLQSFNDPITGLPNTNAPFYAAQLGVREAP
jgi:hypothetical protein